MMTLTSMIEDKASPVRRWMDSRIDTSEATLFVRGVNDQLAKRQPIFVEGSDFRVVGTAFDYGFRWALNQIRQKCLARNGARNYQHFHEWDAAPEIVEAILQVGYDHSDLETRSRCCIVLAWFESGYRRGELPSYLEPFVGAPANSTTVDHLIQHAPLPSVADLKDLLLTISSVWGADLELPCVPNPTFSGSNLVGKADADWIMGETLCECKCSKKTRPFERNDLLQGIGYVLLDTKDDYHIRNLCWYYARQQVRLSYPIAELFNRLLGSSHLPDLRADFSQELKKRLEHNGVSH